MKYLFSAFIFSLLAVAALSSCSYQPPKDVNSSFYAPPVGSQLTLHRAITLPANSFYIRIQDGHIINSTWDIDTYYANCDFELRNQASVERTIQADTFNVSRVYRDTENVMLSNPTVLASRISVNDGGPPLVNYMTMMDLYSPRQPDVLRMSCQHWNDPNDGEHLSIIQIRKTLGALFSLTLASD